jgi:uncharacterized cofD-like protein
MIQKKIRIAVIGGGTGTMPVLAGLKKYNDIELSVIVSMMDDGGSNIVVRDEFGLLPLSDLRKSIIALSSIGNGILRDLFLYRFDKGRGFSGHTLGNIIMMALSDIKKSEVGAIEAVCRLFNTKGKVIPVTLDDVRLVAEYDNGMIIKGEHLIDEPEEDYGARIRRIYVQPKAQAHFDALSALIQADYIIAGPGDLYTNTIANIIVHGISRAICQSKAQFIFIGNLMTKKGQTHGMKATGFVNEITRYSGRKPDFALINKGKINKEFLERYEKKGDFPVEDDLRETKYLQVIRNDFISNSPVKAEKGDILPRSLIRHDAEKLGKVLYSIVKKRENLKGMHILLLDEKFIPGRYYRF